MSPGTTEQKPKEMLLEKSVQHRLEEYGTVRHFHEGDVILKEDAYIKVIPIVLRGSMRVMRSDEEGKEILLYYIRPGETCIMSFLAGINDDTSKVKAIVEEDSDLLLIPVDKASELVKTYPEWTDFIFRLYHKRFEELLNVVNSIAFRKLDQRLLDFLRKKSQLLGTKEIGITHQQLADEIGTSREVVSRLLKQMENENLVRLSRNKIQLL